MKHFNLTNIAYLNLKLVAAIAVLHWLSLYDMLELNPPFISERILPSGFYLDQYFFFGIAGAFTIMFLFMYPPVALFDLFIAKLSTRFTKDISVSASDMKFKKGKHIENLIRLVTYALMCLTPYLFIESLVNAVLILPFTFFHMILMAITTFTHGLQLLAIYRVISRHLHKALRNTNSKHLNQFLLCNSPFFQKQYFVYPQSFYKVSIINPIRDLI